MHIPDDPYEKNSISLQEIWVLKPFQKRKNRELNLLGPVVSRGRQA
jgi:hypothetical protein